MVPVWPFGSLIKDFWLWKWMACIDLCLSTSRVVVWRWGCDFFQLHEKLEQRRQSSVINLAVMPNLLCKYVCHSILTQALYYCTMINCCQLSHLTAFISISPASQVTDNLVKLFFFFIILVNVPYISFRNLKFESIL